MGKCADVLERALSAPVELHCMLNLKFGGKVGKVSKVPLRKQALELTDNAFCYSVLNKVSRSFAVVIRNLPENIMDAVCLFYLILRGLDSVEDDMRESHMPNKEKMLREFHEYLEDPTWSVVGVGDSPDYEILLEYFPKVTREYLKLPFKYRMVISDITQRMGAGMADFAAKLKNGKGTCGSVADYNLYCHYVAGLVGHGLIGIFAASGLEAESLASETKIANNMGLFLQKTNIIRDYCEDLDDGRTWWPEEIWSKHSDSLESLRGNKETGEVQQKALDCLNELVTDTLSLVPDCIKFMSLLKDPNIFVFCAVPQVMAIATLTKCYNNPKIFKGVVKIRKGLASRIMLETKDMAAVRKYFHDFLLQMESKIPRAVDSKAAAANDATRELIASGLELTASDACQTTDMPSVLSLSFWLLLVVVIFVCARMFVGPAEGDNQLWFQATSSWAGRFTVLALGAFWASLPVFASKRRALA